MFEFFLYCLAPALRTFLEKKKPKMKFYTLCTNFLFNTLFTLTRDNKAHSIRTRVKQKGKCQALSIIQVCTVWCNFTRSKCCVLKPLH